MRSIHAAATARQLTDARCAACGTPCGPGAAHCPGAQLPDGSVDYRDQHSLCATCLGVMMGSQEGCQAIGERVERTLAWRGHA